MTARRFDHPNHPFVTGDKVVVILPLQDDLGNDVTKVGQRGIVACSHPGKVMTIMIGDRPCYVMPKEAKQYFKTVSTKQG